MPRRCQGRVRPRRDAELSAFGNRSLAAASPPNPKLRHVIPRRMASEVYDQIPVETNKADND